MVVAQTWICPLENEGHKILNNKRIQTDHLISSRRPHLVLINKEKIFIIQRIWLLQCTKKWKIKESEDIDEYLDLARKLKRL